MPTNVTDQFLDKNIINNLLEKKIKAQTQSSNK